ncbi:MAG TPA: VWA domain-containing protein, partial [Candidatus Angelobacter sp.]|nr:VWA domain-containing protein [Candidatus Angelobacter sp.]
MKTITRLGLPFALAMIGACSSTLAAQSAPSVTTQSAETSTQAPFVFKSSSRLVLVDVVATNGKGEPITDLKTEDFVVSEDGRSQTVSSFSFQQPSTASSATENAAQPLPSGEVTNVPRFKKGDIWNVIVLDVLNSPMLDQSDTRQQFLKVLARLPNQPVAIYTLGSQLRLVQDFSSDPALLKQAIAGLNNKTSLLLDNPKGGHEGARYPPGYYDMVPDEAKAGILRWEGGNTATRTRTRLQITLDSLNAIAANLKNLPGRKNLIWVSEGFPFSIEPGSRVQAHEPVTSQDYTVDVSRTANALFDSQIAIYPIDSRGMVLNQVYDPSTKWVDALGRGESEIGINSTVSEQLGNLDATHTSMQEMAERTGGKAFYNQNEIGKAIVDSMNDGSTYYTLAYSPSNGNWNGKFRHISVKSTRSGVKLRYRLGYFAMQPNAYSNQNEKEQASIFEHAMDISAPASTAVLFHAHIFPPSEKTQNQVVVNYSIAAGLSFKNSPDQLEHASVNCAVEVYSAKGEPIKKDATILTAA